MDSITLHSDDVSIEVSPYEGGRITSLRSNTVDRDPELIVSRDERLAMLGPRPAIGPSPLEWGCFPMAPWPGRVASGMFSFEGAEHRIPTNLGNSAIHGTVFAHKWQVIAQSSSRVVLETEFGPSWPWVGRVTESIAIRRRGFETRIEIEAGPGERFPAGAGFHPWFRRRGCDPSVQVRADQILETDGGLIPSGRRSTPSGDEDLRDGPKLGERRIDTVYGGVVAPQVIAWDDLILKVSADNAAYACVYTPPEGFCVEPMTCAADAFNLESAGFDAGIAVVTTDSPLAITAQWDFEPAP